MTVRNERDGFDLEAFCRKGTLQLVYLNNEDIYHHILEAFLVEALRAEDIYNRGKQYLVGSRKIIPP